MRRSLLVACFMTLALCGCEPGGIGDTPGPGPDLVINPGGGDAGAACSGDSKCKSNICYRGACARACAGSSQCGANQDCGSDDGKRLLCYDRRYSPTVGSSCAVAGSCAGALRCVGGGKLFPGSYCTATCVNDTDCPGRYTCRQLGSAGRVCARREFCDQCSHDGQCGADSRCIQQGGRKVCARRCTAGSTVCPTFARCQAVAGGNYCVHRAGSCVGDGGLCSACNDTGNCKSGACFTYSFSDESFCATGCSGSGSCPKGYFCHAKHKRCVPDKATCVGSFSNMMEVGAIMDDYAVVGYTDTNNNHSLTGEPLRLIKLSDYAKNKKLILLSVATGWCKSCQVEAQSFASLMKTYGPKGLIIIQTLTDGLKVNTAPTVGLLNNWVSQFKSAGAAGLDPGNVAARYNTKKGTVPLNMLIDAKTRRVLEKWNEGTVAQLKSRIAARLP